MVINGSKVGIKRKQLIFSCQSVGYKMREFEDLAVSVTFDRLATIKIELFGQLLMRGHY